MNDSEINDVTMNWYFMLVLLRKYLEFFLFYLWPAGGVRIFFPDDTGFYILRDSLIFL